MNISIFGIGYVGCVSVGCLSEHKHSIIAVDLDINKVKLINSGKATIIEKDISKFIKNGVNNKLIKATDVTSKAVMETDVAIICVGTPNTINGQLDMSNIYTVAESIGKALRAKNTFYTISIRSTVMPGTNRKVVEIISEKSGKIVDQDFAVVSNPEFLREGNAVDDFFNPPYTIVGSSSEKGIGIINEIFSFISAPFITVDIQVAELIKFLNNTFHALKVSFGNEIGRICKNLSIDGQELMNLFIKDTSLNISPKYFRPGAAYGGSCLPKDLKALNTIAHDAYINVPILRSINKSNEEHIAYIYNKIINYRINNIGIYGLSFKRGTDDLRFSSSLELCERLLGKGYNLKIFDNNVVLSQLMGQNKSFLVRHLPHIEKLLNKDIDNFLADIELVVFMHDCPNLNEWKNKLNHNLIIIDVVGINEIKHHPNYDGVCW